MWPSLLFAGIFPRTSLALANCYHLLCVSSLASQSHCSSAGQLAVAATSLVKRSQRKFINLTKEKKILFYSSRLFFFSKILDYEHGLCCAAIAALYPESLKEGAGDRLSRSSFHWTTKSHAFLLVSSLWAQECMDAFCIANQLQQERQRWVGHAPRKQLHFLEQFSKLRFFKELNFQDFRLLICVEGSKMWLR